MVLEHDAAIVGVSRNAPMSQAFYLTEHTSTEAIPKPEQGGVEVGNKVRVFQVLIILSALVGLFALQSARSRPGVLTGVTSSLRT